jgi:cation diffusion facilitator CzcD-associated flavoprotein CzcO
MTSATTAGEAASLGTMRAGVVIVGTGFSGLGMAIRLKQRGMHDFVILEKADDIGGTWRENTYPGCACDIPSHLYSFSFAPNPDWTRFYAPWNEIQAYLRTTAERFGILPHIRWSTQLERATWSDDEACWHLDTTQGHCTASILILGNGPLHEPSIPVLPGLDHFNGVVFHSARWRHDVDLRGKRVAVIGTGASGIQFVPQIQPLVDHLALYQRTPAWIVPRLDHPITARQQARYHDLPVLQRLERARIYWQREIGALGLVYRQSLLESFQRIALRHLERQVHDPELRAKLTPSYRIGCKRILLADDFYPAVSQPNVDVITTPIRAVTPTGIVAADGTERPADAIICATGFHVTDTQLPHAVYGREGRPLADSWVPGPRAYLGTAVSGFPNLFILVGPNTGLGHNSMVYMIESQVRYILDALRLMQRRCLRTVEAMPEAQQHFNEEMERRMATTVWKSGCASWYLDSAGYNSTLWPGFTFEFRHRTRRFDLKHYATTPARATTQLTPSGALVTSVESHSASPPAP